MPVNDDPPVRESTVRVMVLPGPCHNSLHDFLACSGHSISFE